MVNKAGRKPIAPSKRKERVVGIRITAAEYGRMKARAENMHIPVAAWARAQLLRCLSSEEEQEATKASMEKARRQQERGLTKTQELLHKTVRLYQTAIRETRDDPDGSEGEDR